MEQPQIRPDLMMEEIHRLRQRVQQEVEGLEPEERVRWYQEQTRQLAETYGFTLVPHSDRPRAVRLESVERPEDQESR